MRFTKSNWNKFFDASSKKTTIRLRKSKIGHHNAYAGNYYKSELLGEFEVTSVIELKFKDLKQEHAKYDGFNNLKELQDELCRLNGELEPDTLVYQHWIGNVIKNEQR